MSALLSLWLPILLSAVVVFVISSVVHMVTKWHAPDYRGFSNEDAVREAIRAGNPSPGQYVLPYCGDMKEMGSEVMLRKYREGPVGHITLAPSGDPKLGKPLVSWFLFSVFVATVAAFLATRSHAPDPAHGAAAATLVGAVSFVAYGFGTITESIWMARPWSSSARYLLDAALYATGSALVFFWLWP